MKQENIIKSDILYKLKKFVKKYSHLENVKEEYIYHNMNINVDFILENQNINWEKYCIELNIKDDYKIIEENTDIYIDYSMLSMILDVKYIERHPEYEWDYEVIQYNPTINMNYIENNSDYFIENENIEWSIISSGDNITFNDIKNNPTYLWDWYGVSLNPNITFDIITNNINEKWTECVIMNENITIEEAYILKNLLDIEDNNFYDLIVQNPNLTQQDIEEIGYENINWNELSLNPMLSIDFIEKHIDKKWNFRSILIGNPLFGEYVKTSKEYHKKKYKSVLNEFNSVVFHPKNIQYFLVQNKLMDKQEINFWNL